MTFMYKHTLGALLFLVNICSCGLNSNGKLVYENENSCESQSKLCILRNTSNTDIITFTIKKSFTVVRYEDYDSENIIEKETGGYTKLYTLYPGEEEKLGCEIEKSLYGVGKTIYNNNYKIVGEFKGKKD